MYYKLVVITIIAKAIVANINKNDITKINNFI